jgi:hypothetical protein
MDQTVAIFDPFRTKQQIITLKHHKGFLNAKNYAFFDKSLSFLIIKD